MSVPRLGGHPSLAAYEQGQERLCEAILSACEADAGLPATVEAALLAALALLASEPDLAHLLFIWPDRADTQAWRCQEEWRRRYGEMLRDAAARGGAPALPFFLEPTLIGGVDFLVARHARRGEARQLERLLPTIHWYLLSYYLSPAELSRLRDDLGPDLDPRTS